jgi:hypothetical protein
MLRKLRSDPNIWVKLWPGMVALVVLAVIQLSPWTIGFVSLYGAFMLVLYRVNPSKPDSR